jgi:hypothetical protein
MSHGAPSSGVVLRDNSGRALLTTDGAGNLTVANSLAGGLASDVLHSVDVTISAADIIDTASGKFGHANGYPLVAGAGADVAIEFVSATLVSDRSVAAYTAGGNISVNLSAGGAAQSGIVSAANSLGAATDKQVVLYPLTTAAVPLVANAGLNLVSSAAFTNPGTAAGVIRVRVNYRLHTLGLV